MALRPLKSFFATADQLLRQDLPTLGRVLLVHLKSYEDVPHNSIYQHGRISQLNFFAALEASPGPGQQLEYGDKQQEVIRALMEAWNWLERQGTLIGDARQPAPWFSISRSGEELLKQNARFEHFERLGLARVKGDLEATGGIRDIGGPQEVIDLAWKWVEMKENQAKAGASSGTLSLIAETRLDELRGLGSARFDFRRLIRLCEEINTSYAEGCYFATAMLTRALLDHVPPLFGCKTFDEVANNYDGGKSFKETMHHLENAARKVADSHLHIRIRKSETLPTAQQVYFAPELDVLLAEVVRLMR